MKHPIRHLLFLFIALSPLALAAQETAAQPCRLHLFTEPIIEGVYEGMKMQESMELTITWPSEVPEAPPESEHFEIAFGQLAKGAELPAGAGVRLYLGKPADLMTAKPFAEHTLDPNASDMLLYMIPTARNRYQTSLHNFSPDLVEGGSARLINVSSETLAAELNEERGILTPGASLAASLAELRRFHIRMRIAAAAEEGWRPVHAARVTAKPTDRMLVLISQRRGDSGPWRVRSIRLP